VLNLICVYYFYNAKVKKKSVVITSVLILVLVAVPISNSYAFWEKPLVEDESLYNYLRVTEDENSIVLSTNVAYGVQSILKKNSIFSDYYYDYALSLPLFLKDMDLKQKKEILILGMGTGTYAKECKYFFPNVNITGVEIDQKIVDLSKKYFQLTDEEAKVFVNDGRTFLMSEDAEKYDVIMVDAYHDITIPFHMSSREFFAQVKEHLKPGGVIMVNLNMRSTNNTELTDYFKQTVKASFEKAYFFNISHLTNSVIFASDDPGMLQNYKSNIKKVQAGSQFGNILKYVDDSLNEITESRLVFTDEVAPVEVLGQKMIDDVISEELSYIKDMISKSSGGLKGLLELISGD
jgi:spermidine synthase